MAAAATPVVELVWGPPPPPPSPTLPSIEKSDYVYKLIGSTLVPLAIVVLVILGELIHALAYKTDLFGGMGLKYMIMMLFFTLPTISSIITATFATKDFYNGVDDDGVDLGADSYMLADLSILAEGDRYKFIMRYVWIMVAVYPVGVPATLFVLLWRHRREIEARQSRKGGPELASLAFLFRLYSRR